jgi:hypothetical protein
MAKKKNRKKQTENKDAQDAAELRTPKGENL